MGKSLIDKAIDSIFDAEWVGRRGERLCESELRWVRLLGRKGTVLRNAYVPKRGGGTSEVDVLFVTRKGGLRHRVEELFRLDLRERGAALLDGGAEGRPQGPLLQPRHEERLPRQTAARVPRRRHSPLLDRRVLRALRAEGGRNVRRGPRNQTGQILCRRAPHLEREPDALSEEQAADVVSRLETLTRVGAAAKRGHVAAIRERFGE